MASSLLYGPQRRIQFIIKNGPLRTRFALLRSKEGRSLSGVYQEMTRAFSSLGLPFILQSTVMPTINTCLSVRIFFNEKKKEYFFSFNGLELWDI
jgi:hypothetical protein